jgi:hypothetical protein
MAEEKWTCVQSGPLSGVSKYVLYVNGECGSREIRNMIRVLEMQAEWLSTDENAAPSPSRHASEET